MNKKRSKPVMLRMGGISEAIQNAQDENDREIKYIKETGLCPECKTNTCSLPEIRCEKCLKEIDEIINKLRGPGFMIYDLVPVAPRGEQKSDPFKRKIGHSDTKTIRRRRNK